MEGIEWRDIPGTNGRYQASNTGLIKTTSNSATRKEKILCPGSWLGYKKVNICDNGIQKSRSVHRLVASTFIPNPDSKPQINHIDCNPSNNHMSNLEWCTYEENMAHKKIMNRPHKKRERKKFAPKIINPELVMMEYEITVKAIIDSYLDRSVAAKSLNISCKTLTKRIKLGNFLKFK